MAGGGDPKRKNAIVLSVSSNQRRVPFKSAGFPYIPIHPTSFSLISPRLLIPLGHLFPTPLYHSPSIAAVSTEQGVVSALQEIEVPFGSQRPQRKHVTHEDTLWTHAPIARLWAHLCAPHTPNGASLASLTPPLGLWVDTLQAAQLQAMSAQHLRCVAGQSGCDRGTGSQPNGMCAHARGYLTPA